MQKGQKATNSAHRGVQIVRKGTKLVLRFKDPIEGRYRDQSLGEVSRPEAVQAAKAKHEALQSLKRKWVSGELTHTPVGTDLITEFVEDADTAGTKSVRELGANYLRRMQKAMLTRSWHELQRHDLQRLQQIIVGDNKLGPTTKNLRIRTCKTFFNWLNERGALGSVNGDIITQSLKMIKAPEHKHGRILQPHELQVLFSVMVGERPEVGLFFMLKVLTGLRIGELVNIRVKDIVSGKGLKPYLSVAAPKTNRTRKVNLSSSPLAHTILENLKDGSSDYVFLPEHKDRTDTVGLYRRFQRHLVRTISKKTHLKVNPKDLRATNEAMLATLEGWDIFKVARQLGHSTAIANQAYTEDIQMQDFPAGKSIEEVAGLEKIGFRMLKANGMNARITEALQAKERELDNLHQSRMALILGELKEWVEIAPLMERIQGMELTSEIQTEIKAQFTDAYAQRLATCSDPEKRQALQDTFLHVMQLMDTRVNHGL